MLSLTPVGSRPLKSSTRVEAVCNGGSYFQLQQKYYKEGALTIAEGEFKSAENTILEIDDGITKTEMENFCIVYEFLFMLSNISLNRCSAIQGF